MLTVYQTDLLSEVLTLLALFMPKNTADFSKFPLMLNYEYTRPSKFHWGSDASWCTAAGQPYLKNEHGITIKLETNSKEITYLFLFNNFKYRWLVLILVHCYLVEYIFIFVTGSFKLFCRLCLMYSLHRGKGSQVVVNGLAVDPYAINEAE